jgi:hypothetical protein
VSSGGFVPGGGFVATNDLEEFPTIGDIGSKPKKKAAQPVAHQPTAEDLLTTHKGRPSKFFDLPVNGKPNGDQMAFVYEFYPEYGGEENFRPFFASLKANAESSEIANKPYEKAKKKKEQVVYAEYSSEEEPTLGSGIGKTKKVV